MHPIATQLIGQDQTDARIPTASGCSRDDRAVRRAAAASSTMSGRSPAPTSNLPQADLCRRLRALGLDDRHRRLYRRPRGPDLGATTQRAADRRRDRAADHPLVSVAGGARHHPADSAITASDEALAGRTARCRGAGHRPQRRDRRHGRRGGSVQDQRDRPATAGSRAAKTWKPAPPRSARPIRSRLADEFESAIGEIVETVSSASHELEASAAR